MRSVKENVTGHFGKRRNHNHWTAILRMNFWNRKKQKKKKNNQKPVHSEKLIFNLLQISLWGLKAEVHVWRLWYWGQRNVRFGPFPTVQPIPQSMYEYHLLLKLQNRKLIGYTKDPLRSVQPHMTHTVRFSFVKCNSSQLMKGQISVRDLIRRLEPDMSLTLC